MISDVPVTYALDTPIAIGVNPQVRFTLLRAGVTEFITEDGLVVQLRIKIKNVMRVDAPLGGIPYALELEIVPSAAPALQPDRDDTPNFGRAYAPVGRKLV